MPAIYWLPLPAMHGPAAVEHVHAAFSGWFDAASDRNAHHDTVKPYRLAPLSQQEGSWGAEVALLSAEAYQALAQRLEDDPRVRLGRISTPVGPPRVLQGATWDELGAWPGERAWRVTFLTPFASRTGNRTSPFPSPPVVLRGPAEAWRWYSGREELRLSPTEQANLWVSHLDLATTTFTVNGHRHHGALGSITYQASTDEVARMASTLFRLAEYSGMGSFRGKGMGVVDVQAV